MYYTIIIICYKFTSFFMFCQFQDSRIMADDGEEFVVDKILDKRVRNGKVSRDNISFLF